MPSKKKRKKQKKKGNGQGSKSTSSVANQKEDNSGTTPDVNTAYEKLRLQLSACNKKFPGPVDTLRLKYTLLGKEEWWFIMDECLEEFGKILVKNDYLVIDWFISKPHVDTLKKDVRKVYENGKLRLGVLAGGKSGSSLTYTHTKVRGDVVEWFDGSEPYWQNGTDLCLSNYLQKIDTFVSELSQHLTGLEGVLNRSKAMVTCYPGNGARYIKHTDNHCKFGAGDDCNGRRLTTLLYLNSGWKKGDGGELRIFDRDGETIKAEVEPCPGRTVLFWSDFRVPHEVLPTQKERFAITTWYFDNKERARALAAGVTDTEEGKRTGVADRDREYVRIQKEVESMVQKFGKEGLATNVSIAGNQDDAPEAPVARPGELKTPDTEQVENLDKIKNSEGQTTSASFVRVAVVESEDSSVDSDDEVPLQKPKESDQVKVGIHTEKEPMGDKVVLAPPSPHLPSESTKSSVYATLEEENDVWELDD